MLQFILGVIVGSIIGFLVCAVLSINNFEKDREQPTHSTKETGDSDAGK